MRRIIYTLSLLTCCLASAWAQGTEPDENDGWYELQTAEDLTWFAQKVNDGERGLNARLMADIDYTEATTMIGVNNDYEGTFDGQGHQITIDLKRDADGGAFFWGINPGGKVCNLHVAGTIHTSAKYAGGITSYLRGTIENCWSSVQILSDTDGDGTHGGIAGEGFSGFVIRNTLSSGAITGEKTNCCGGMIGWADGSGNIDNCLNLTVMDLMDDGGCDTFARNNGNMHGKGNYYTSFFGNVKDECATLVQFEQLKSGEVCFRLNGDQQNILWHQTLGEDLFPTPMPTGSQVYAQGRLKCDGSFEAGTTFQNTPGSALPDHNYQEGYCTACGKEQPGYFTTVDGFYLIDTPEKLVWFANKVNSGSNTINGKLTEDINMNLSEKRLPTIASDGNRYKGTFDGDGHTLTVNIPTSYSMPALFGYTGTGAIVRNLTVNGRIETGSKFACGLAAHACGGTFENCVSQVEITSLVSGDGTHAGLIGIVEDPVTIRNCVFAGSIMGDNTDNCAGMVGWASARVDFENCLQIADIQVQTGGSNTYCRNSGNGHYTNCYYLHHFNDTPSGCKAIEAEDLLSGKATFNLNAGNTTDPAWYQTLQQDAYPVPNSTHGIVFQIADEQYISLLGEEDFPRFKTELMQKENEYVELLMATNTLRDAYQDLLVELEEIEDMEAFLEAFRQSDATKQQLLESAKAYKAYQDAIDYVRNYLDNDQSFGGPDRELLKSYLDNIVEPNEEFPNGSYWYIVDENNLLLDAEGAMAEALFVQKLLEEAISKGYKAGSDITRLLANADFQEGFNGWQGKVGTGYGNEGPVGVGESWNQNTDMYQQLSGLTNGVYMLSVNAAYRPYTDASSQMYGGMIYTNDNYNYVQSDYEAMIPLADAKDKENCYLPGNVGKTDLEVYDRDGNLLGYTLHSIPSCYYAFQADRCQNYILTNVTDGTLKVGLQDRGTGCGNDWMGFGNIHLTFCGSLEDAGEALDQTLQGMLDRAETVLNFEISIEENFARHPNFSKALRQELTSIVESSSSVQDNAGKYDLICRLSALFQEIHSCRRAYADMVKLAESIDGTVSMLQGETISNEEAASIRQSCQEIWTAFEQGTYSTQEAQEAAPLSNTGLFPAQKDGVYEIGNNTQMAFFSVLVNNGDTQAKARLTGDIDNFTKAMMMKEYAGDFDGNGHTINLNIKNDQEYSSLFANLNEGGVVHDLKLTGEITTSAKFGSSVAGQIFKGTARNIESYVTINSTVNGDGTHAGIFAIVQTGATLENCLYAGSIKGGNATNNCAGMVGWLSGKTTFDNCLTIAEMEVSTSGSATFARNAGGNATLTNCYYLNRFGDVESGATLVSADQLESGEVCYLLNNGDTEAPTWRQNLDEDKHPVLLGNHSIVMLNEDGKYSNLSDGVATIHSAATSSDATYTLSGIRTTDPKSGIFIRGGRKYVVK